MCQVFMLYTAHNYDACLLVENILQYLEHEKIIIIYAMDKDYIYSGLLDY